MCSSDLSWWAKPLCSSVCAVWSPVDLLHVATHENTVGCDRWEGPSNNRLKPPSRGGPRVLGGGIRAPQLSRGVRHSRLIVRSTMRTTRTVASMSAQTQTFRSRARIFCELVAGHKHYPLRRLLRRLHHLLPVLYGAGLQLPDITPKHDASYARVGNRERSRLSRSLESRLGTRTLYSEVFDAYDRHDQRSLIGSLAGDLSSIYAELTNGFRCWRAGDRENAVWEWRYGLEINWGEHATGAMRALYWLQRNHDFGPPAAMPNNRLKLPARGRRTRKSRRRPRAAA